MTPEELTLIRQLITEIQNLTSEVSKIKVAVRNISNNDKGANPHFYQN